ncbi:WYL domain-containing protein, partial [Pseudomonas aeruginosa]|nr:WYL domain-containing protein [Pseudomonas aeruginosa]
DRESSEFRDFVITRVGSIKDAGQARVTECANEDDDWSRRVVLELVPHPELERKEPVLCDYPFNKDGVMLVKVRAAVAGYALRQWGVDCSLDHSGSAREYQLWLRNREALYGVPNLVLAPGYAP